MKKIVFWPGIAVFILGFLAFFLSGSTSGPDLEPTVPFLYGTNQTYWMLMAFAGVIISIVGAFLKEKKKK